MQHARVWVLGVVRGSRQPRREEGEDRERVGTPASKRLASAEGTKVRRQRKRSSEEGEE